MYGIIGGDVLAPKHLVVAIDPLALVLPSSVYIILHKPDPPPEFKVAITEAAAKMSAADKKAALANATFLKMIAEQSIQALSV